METYHALPDLSSFSLTEVTKLASALGIATSSPVSKKQTDVEDKLPHVNECSAIPVDKSIVCGDDDVIDDTQDISWLVKSEEQAERQNPDFELSDEENYEDINLVIPNYDPQTDRVLLVFESKLKELLKFCPKCGTVIDSTLTTENKYEGSQLTLHLHCLHGCDLVWCSQPTSKGTKGILVVPLLGCSSWFCFNRNLFWDET